MIESTDRYEALGIMPNNCDGPCEGTKWVPVQLDGEADERLIRLWHEAHEKRGHDCDGWHFVPCPDCNSTAWLVAR